MIVRLKRGPRLEGPGSEARATAVKARFARVTRGGGKLAVPRARRPARRLDGLTVWLVVWAGCVGASIAVIAIGSPEGSWSERLRHVAAAPNCAAARAMMLAPALRGAPGYWSQHDRDRDGIACEPFGEG